MENTFTVVRGNVDAVISILKEVSSWGPSVGLNLWKEEYLTKDKLMANATYEDFCVGQVDGDNACCMILQWKDDLFWPKAKENEAGYVHKLCVRRPYAGNSLSKKLIDYAIEECKKKNVHYLRLDTGLANTKLCALYRSYGFEIVDKIVLEDRGAFALFEMKI
ncbi:GNAT family N-acetyltransferase [Clostridium sp. 19966]|uniref:GNAT family N-acetyltransferase n=1 Tax=Clostridium sp. 19966 TaxID=2768166 RepID=UPI0028DF0A48|nr:GNAT family N-acetyltransferase [Clostridium sp. 19966]MDT8717733.1 GNAT family N-acetyltransferase [Clostridium sp. 19966]